VSVRVLRWTNESSIEEGRKGPRIEGTRGEALGMATVSFSSLCFIVSCPDRKETIQ
jgi:hypothetical protein